MGAKQRAQGRGKKVANGSMKGSPASQKQINQNIAVQDLSPGARAKSLQGWSAQSGSGRQGFSMSDQARNTDRRGWSDREQTNYRAQAIGFVSAGHLRKDEDAWNTVSEDDTSPQKQSDVEAEAQAAAESAAEVLAARDEQIADASEKQQGPQTGMQPEAEDEVRAEVNDVQPEPEPVMMSKPIVAPRAPSPSSDSEEEIVFQGRNNPQHSRSRPTEQKPVASKAVVPQPTVVDVEEEEEQLIVQTQEPIHQMFAQNNTVQSIPMTTLSLDSPAERPSSSAKPKRGGKLKYGRKYDEDELMQDYIDNMAKDDEEEEEDGENDITPMRKFKKKETYRLFRGSGLENAKVQTHGRSGRRVNGDIPIDSLPTQAIDWDSDDLADFDDLSTTDEEVDEVEQVIRHRERESGTQYLVIGVGNDASNAKWVLQGNLTSESAKEEVKIFQDIQLLEFDEEDSEDEEEDDDSDSDEDLQDLIDEIESEDDENTAIMKMTSQMTDEQIARALAKQEELGLGSDELLIFDGDTPNGRRGNAGIDDDFLNGDGFIPFSLAKHTSNRGRSKRNKKHRDSFPSAEAFADALDQDPYGAFDIMDFNRPSLRKNNKGKKGNVPYDLDGLDEELADQLVSTWTKDREKKANRKAEREAQRLQDALSMAESGDPTVVKARIRAFLMSETIELRLSPMDSSTRAGVHRLAKSLKLNSHSEGKEGLGMGRYPVLTKTHRTPSYTIGTIWEIDNLMNMRKFFPREKGSYKKDKPAFAGRTFSARRGGGGVMSGATYRDGDEVAASAPELGADNKGRAMLEKMGWSSGMGIGAIGNKGSLDPIKHIVKTTKAGLG